MGVRKIALQLCSRLNYRLDIDSLTDCLNSDGWQICDYDNELFSVLHCADIANACNAFTYYDSVAELRLVFVNRQRLSQEALRLALLHELCHITLGHHHQHTACDYNDLAEHAAEELAVTMRQIVAFYPRRQRLLLLSIILLLILAALFCCVSQTQEKAANGVYITASGLRYHNIDCYHIENADIILVTLNEALAMGRTPCKDCIPQE